MEIGNIQYVQSEAPFDVTLPNDNILGSTPGVQKMAFAGYWITLKPLSSGK